MKPCDGEMVICFDAVLRTCFLCSKCGLLIPANNLRAGMRVRELIVHSAPRSAQTDNPAAPIGR